ncbi:MAG: hypothetical protein ABSG01_13170 [Anaerolineales bacterium]|jgi:hypothetical protein
MLPEPIAVTIKVTDALEKLGVPYFIGGSLASTLYGMVRTTQDSDIVADMRSEHVRPFITALQNEFFVDELMIGESIQTKSNFNIIHRASMFKVDIFIPQPRPFLLSQLARAQVQKFAADPEVSARFASAEDTILSKLEWYRQRGEVADLQWRDVLGVLRTRAGALDLEYLRMWGKELKVSDLLEQLLEESTS